MAEADEFQTNIVSLLQDPNNSVIKAREVFKKKVDKSIPLSIFLNKKIPFEAGLGGGSSNAATTLWALNEIYGHPLSTYELRELGLLIGADVPFFFSSGCAFCEGKGEIIRDVKPPILNDFWIAKPKNFALSTPLMYKNFSFNEANSLDPMELLDKILSGKDGYSNDFQKTAFRLLPELQKIYSDLVSLGFEKVVMTGSGTAFFCLGDLKNPSLNDVIFHKVRLIQRKQDAWYNSSF